MWTTVWSNGEFGGIFGGGFGEAGRGDVVQGDRRLVCRTRKLDQLSTPAVVKGLQSRAKPIEWAVLWRRRWEVAMPDDVPGRKVSAGKVSAFLAAAVAAVVGFAVAAAHDMVPFMEEATHGGASTVRDLHPAPIFSDVLDNPALKPALRQAVTTFRGMRNGDPEEKLVAKAACAVMNSGASGSSTQDEYESSIRQQIPSDLLTDLVVYRYAPRAANALWVAQLNGGLGKWYLQYCVHI
jgi:hypothetical protein